MGDSFEVAEVTDSLETLGVLRFWKNTFLIVILISMLVTQAGFWLVDLKLVSGSTQTGSSLATSGDTNVGLDVAAVGVPEEDHPVEFAFTTGHWTQMVQIANGTAILGVILYCLTIRSCMLITAVGRLGGLGHVCRAFFLALVVLVLLLPWQHLLGPFVLGTLYGPGELMTAGSAKSEGGLALVLYYLRFCGLWLLCLILLLASQFKCAHWASSILRRLEII